jgi:hypothetical protein
MPESDPAPFRLSDAQDANLSAYHALSGLAVGGLVLGGASALALLDPLGWVVPWAGAVTSSLALWRIARNAPAQTGRRLAVAGLLLSVALGVAATTDWVVYRRLIRNEARRFAALWFEYLRQGEPQKAYQLTQQPKIRQPLDQRLWYYYRRTPGSRERLEKYVQDPLLRTLLALGPRADVRYYCCGSQGRREETETVDLIYAVSYDTPDGKQTFFANLGLERCQTGADRVNWRLAHAEGGVRPPGW